MTRPVRDCPPPYRHELLALAVVEAARDYLAWHFRCERPRRTWRPGLVPGWGRDEALGTLRCALRAERRARPTWVGRKGP